MFLVGFTRCGVLSLRVGLFGLAWVYLLGLSGFGVLVRCLSLSCLIVIDLMVDRF